MSDKVQKIKEEIERRISQFEAKYPKDLGGYWNDEESAAYDCAEEYKQFLLFIDSLPEEHNEDLEEEITKCYKSRNDLMMTRNQFGELIHRFTEWQKKKDMQDFLEKAKEFFIEQHAGMFTQFKNYMQNESEI